MTVNIPLSYKVKAGEKTAIEDVEYESGQIPDSDFSKTAARVFDKTENVKDGALPPSKFVDLIETIGEGFNSEELADHQRKVDPNESDSLDRFAFIR